MPAFSEKSALPSTDYINMPPLDVATEDETLIKRPQTEPNEDASKEEKRGAALGVFLGLFASVGFCTMQLCVRVGTKMGMSVELHAVARGIVTIFLSSTVIRSSGIESVSKSDAVLLAFRGVIGSTAMLLKYFAVSLLPLSMATTIIFTAPAITIVLSRILLAEPVEFGTVLACLVSFGGFVLVAFDSHLGTSGLAPNNKVVGITVAVLGAIFTSSAYVVTRWFRTRIHSQWNVFSLGVCSTILGASLLVMERRLASELSLAVSSWRHALILFATGFGSYIGASSINRALQLIPAGTTSVLRAVDIPMSVVYAYIFLGEQIQSWQTLSGTLIILCSSVALGLASAKS